MTEPVSVLGVGGLADAIVAVVLRGGDLRETTAVAKVLDITRPEGPVNLWARFRGDRVALEQNAPAPGHPAHMSVGELRATFEAIDSGAANPPTLERVRAYFGVVATNTLAAMQPPGCGYTPRT